MKKALLAIGIIFLIAGVTLASLSRIPISHWDTFTINNYPKSELALNEAFEIQAISSKTYTVNLSKNDELTINGAITQPGTNRSIGATIDFSIKDSSHTYHSYDKTANVTMCWTVPQSGNYSFIFDNHLDDASKDVIIIVMKSWCEPQQSSILVSTPLLSYWFLWMGVVLCVVGAVLMILAQKKRK